MDEGVGRRVMGRPKRRGWIALALLVLVAGGAAAALWPMRSELSSEFGAWHASSGARSPDEFYKAAYDRLAEDLAHAPPGGPEAAALLAEQETVLEHLRDQARYRSRTIPGDPLPARPDQEAHGSPSPAITSPPRQRQLPEAVAPRATPPGSAPIPHPPPSPAPRLGSAFNSGAPVYEDGAGRFGDERQAFYADRRCELSGDGYAELDTPASGEPQLGLAAPMLGERQVTERQVTERQVTWPGCLR